MTEDRHYALEIRREWAEAILVSKRKTIELRGYRIPEEVGSSRVWLLATEGPAGQPTLGDTITPERDRGKAVVVGWVRFRHRRRSNCGGGEKRDDKDDDDENDEDDGGVIVYRSAAEVAADEDKHLIGPSFSSSSSSSSSAAYGWKEGVTEALFGWRIIETGSVGNNGDDGDGDDDDREGPVDVADAGVRAERLLRSVYRLEREPFLQ